MTRLPRGALVVRRATAADTARIHGLREQLANWLTKRGVAQWAPGEIGVDEVAAQIADRQWWVADAPDGRESPGGALRYLRSDPIWPDDVPAAYVHGLMVDRECAGVGLGTLLLDWARERALRDGAQVLRLDCVETNRPLRDYYAAYGFVEVGRHDRAPGRHPVTLLQRRLLPQIEGP